MSTPVVVVVGAGPGLGSAVARRFGREGWSAGLVTRTEQQGRELGEALQQEGVTAGWAAAEITDPAALSAAVARLGGHTGRIDVLHFNPSVFRERDLMELTPDELLEDVALGVGAVLTAVQAARPFLSAGGRITATGSLAADRPWHRAATLGVQKAGLRNLVRSLDAGLSDAGIRAVSVTVNGTLEPGTRFDPVHVADAIFRAAAQHEDGWQVEIPFDG